MLDGPSLPAESRWPNVESVRRYRPRTVEENGTSLEVENLELSNITNLRGIDILVSAEPAPAQKRVCYKQVTIRNVHISKLARDEMGRNLGLPVEAIRISGDGELQPAETDLLLEDVSIGDCAAVPVLLREGRFGTITFRRVKLDNGPDLTAQIVALGTGTVGHIVIEDSPNLRLTIAGRPTSVQRCTIRRSPGAVVVDQRGGEGGSGVKITTDQAPAGSTTAASSGSVTTAPAATDAEGAPRLKITGDMAKGVITAQVVGSVPSNTAFIVFEVFDKDEYRACQPQDATDPPWSATLTIKRPGSYRVQATIRRPGGISEKPITTTVVVTDP